MTGMFRPDQGKVLPHPRLLCVSIGSMNRNCAPTIAQQTYKLYFKMKSKFPVTSTVTI